MSHFFFFRGPEIETVWQACGSLLWKVSNCPRARLENVPWKKKKSFEQKRDYNMVNLYNKHECIICKKKKCFMLSLALLNLHFERGHLAVLAKYQQMWCFKMDRFVIPLGWTLTQWQTALLLTIKTGGSLFCHGWVHTHKIFWVTIGWLLNEFGWLLVILAINSWK